MIAQSARRTSGRGHIPPSHCIKFRRIGRPGPDPRRSSRPHSTHRRPGTDTALHTQRNYSASVPMIKGEMICLSLEQSIVALDLLAQHNHYPPPPPPPPQLMPRITDSRQCITFVSELICPRVSQDRRALMAHAWLIGGREPSKTWCTLAPDRLPGRSTGTAPAPRRRSHCRHRTRRTAPCPCSSCTAGGVRGR